MGGGASNRFYRGARRGRTTAAAAPVSAPNLARGAAVTQSKSARVIGANHGGPSSSWPGLTRPSTLVGAPYSACVDARTKSGQVENYWMIRGEGRSAEAAAGALDALAGLAQHLSRGRVRDAEMRRQAKGLAMHDRDPGRLEQIADKILVIADRLAVRGTLADDPGAGRVDVKRPLGPRAEQAGDMVQQVNYE